MPPFINAPPLKAPPPYKASPPAASAPSGASSSHQGPAPLSDPVESAQQATAAASTHRHWMCNWMCPACTLFGGRKCLVESVPYHSVNPAGTEHLNSKKHAISIKAAGRHILKGPSIAKFFEYIPDELQLPSGLDIWELEPVDLLRAYIRRCGGDAEMTLDHFVEQGAEDPRRLDPVD